MLGPEMRSTGEVMGLDRDFARAFLKAQLGAGVTLPQSGTVFISVKDDDKAAIAPVAQAIAALGFRILATGGTATYLAEKGLAVEPHTKVPARRTHLHHAIQTCEARPTNQQHPN